MLINSSLYQKWAAKEDERAALSLVRERYPNAEIKSFSEFKTFLDKVLPKLIHKYMIRNQSMNVCSTIAPDFSEIAAAAGYAVLEVKKAGHVVNIVFTTDGPYEVDLSWIQFQCNRDLDWGTKEQREEARLNYKALYNDPWKAVKIEKWKWSDLEFSFPKEHHLSHSPVKSFEAYDMTEEEEDYPEKFRYVKR